MDYKGMKEIISDYLQAHPVVLSENGQILKRIVDEHNKDVLKDEKKVELLLNQYNAEKQYIYKVCLMVNVNGFDELIVCDSRTINSDMMRYVKNAITQTGLERSVILQILTDFAIILNIYEVLDAYLNINSEKSDKPFVFPIPESVYKEELMLFETEFKMIKRAIQKGDNAHIEKLPIEKIIPLIQAGIPKAEYYAGYCLVNGIVLEEDSATGIKLMEKAALSGCVEAACDLGDYYYKKGPHFWSKAYYWYTGLGSLGINSDQKKAICDIYNQKIYNKKIILSTILLIVISLAIVINSPGIPLYSGHRILGFICIAFQILVFVLTIKRWQKYPYDSYYHLPILIFFIMFIFFMIRLFF